MLRRSKIKNIILLLGLITLTALTIINFSYFESFISDFITKQIIAWGYIGFFLFVFLLESIPQPFLSAVILLTTGTLLGLNLFWLFWLTLISSILANYTAYFVGIIFGDELAIYLLGHKKYRRSRKWFEKYGHKSISILALTPLPYFPIMGGIFRMTLAEFTTYAIIPRILHFIIFSTIITLSI